MICTRGLALPCHCCCCCGTTHPAFPPLLFLHASPRRRRCSMRHAPATQQRTQQRLTAAATETPVRRAGWLAMAPNTPEAAPALPPLAPPSVPFVGVCVALPSLPPLPSAPCSGGGLAESVGVALRVRVMLTLCVGVCEAVMGCERLREGDCVRLAVIDAVGLRVWLGLELCDEDSLGVPDSETVGV